MKRWMFLYAGLTSFSAFLSYINYPNFAFVVAVFLTAVFASLFMLSILNYIRKRRSNKVDTINDLIIYNQVADPI